MKALFAGVSIVAVALFISIFSHDWTLLYKITVCCICNTEIGNSAKLKSST